MIIIVLYSERYAQRNMQKLPHLHRPALAALHIQYTLQAAAPHLPMLRRMCHFYNAGLSPQCLVELQFRDRLSAQART